MELFTIQCTTCRARLKVKDESAIGAILACPKCASMVQVVPPVGWKKPAAAEPEPAIRPSAAAAKAVVASVKPPEKAKAAVVVPPVLPPRIPVELPPIVAAGALPIPVAPPVQIAAVPPIVKAGARFKQDWLLLSGGLAAGVAIGICAWLFAFGLGEPAVATPDGPITATMPLASVGHAAENVNAQTEAAEPEETVEASLSDMHPGDQSEAVPAQFEQVADDAAPATEEEATLEDAAPASKVSVAGPAPAKPPAATIKLDPAPKPAAVIEPAAKDADSLASLDEEDPLDAAAALPMPNKGGIAGADPAGPPKRIFSRTEIDERLATPLPTVHFSKVPLSQFTDFIGELTGLTIVLDAEALAGASKTRQTPVTIKLSNTTAGDAIRAALKPLGLAYSVREDGHLVITPDENRRATK